MLTFLKGFVLIQMQMHVDFRIEFSKRHCGTFLPSENNVFQPLLITKAHVSMQLQLPLKNTYVHENNEIQCAHFLLHWKNELHKLVVICNDSIRGSGSGRR